MAARHYRRRQAPPVTQVDRHWPIPATAESSMCVCCFCCFFFHFFFPSSSSGFCFFLQFYGFEKKFGFSFAWQFFSNLRFLKTFLKIPFFFATATPKFALKILFLKADFEFDLSTFNTRGLRLLFSYLGIWGVDYGLRICARGTSLSQNR